jgi:hypothetical protein
MNLWSFISVSYILSAGQENIPAALVWCRGNVYYQVDYRAVIGRKYDPPETYTTTQRPKTSSS